MHGIEKHESTKFQNKSLRPWYDKFISLNKSGQIMHFFNQPQYMGAAILALLRW
jgi:hypothetical protein